MEKGAAVGAGSVVPPGRLIPGGELWSGNPAAFVGPAAEPVPFETPALQAQALAEMHYDEFLPDNVNFWKA